MWNVLNQTDRINQSQVISVLSDLMHSRYWVKEKSEIPTVIVSTHCDFFFRSYFSFEIDEYRQGAFAPYLKNDPFTEGAYFIVHTGSAVMEDSLPQPPN